MVYYKVLLDNRRPKADEIYPVIIRVTHNRKNTSITTGVRISNEFWDFKTGLVAIKHPNHQLLNKSITETFLRVQKIVLQLENEECFSFEQLKERFTNGGKPLVASKINYFNEYAQQLIEDTFAANKAGTAMAYQVAVKRLMGFANNPKLKFTEINYTFLEAFRNQLVKDGLKPNAISTYFRSCRAIYNKAIKAKLVDRSHYAFIDVTIKTERTAKRAITWQELKKLFHYQLKPGSQKFHARNYFILSFTLRGISFSDLAYLTPTNIVKGRLIYQRKKTGQVLNIKLLPLAEQILNYYKGQSTRFLLPILPINIVEGSESARKLIMDRIKTVNKYLNQTANACGVETHITTYVIRHTWATCAKRLGYSNELIAESLGHEYGNKVTNIYLDNFEQDVIDECNYKVVRQLKSQ
jgi:integrase/recombinase XerD